MTRRTMAAPTPWCPSVPMRAPSGARTARWCSNRTHTARWCSNRTHTARWCSNQVVPPGIDPRCSRLPPRAVRPYAARVTRSAARAASSGTAASRPPPVTTRPTRPRPSHSSSIYSSYSSSSRRSSSKWCAARAPAPDARVTREVGGASSASALCTLALGPRPVDHMTSWDLMSHVHVHVHASCSCSCSCLMLMLMSMRPPCDPRVIPM
eukprot:6883833-Prymnesium_polylepis.1